MYSAAETSKIAVVFCVGTTDWKNWLQIKQLFQTSLRIRLHLNVKIPNILRIAKTICCLSKKTLQQVLFCLMTPLEQVDFINHWLLEVKCSVHF